MQPFPPPPVTAGPVVEEMGGGWSRWLRPVAAASASLAVLAASAALWEYGRRAGTATPADPHDILFVAGGLKVGGTAWLRRRTRRDDLRWRPRLALPGGVRPGLVAPRSPWAVAIEVVSMTGIIGSGLVWGGATYSGWGGRILTAIFAAAMLMLALILFRRLRHPALVAITSAGIVAASKAMPWGQIASVRRTKDGVEIGLRSAGGVRWREVGGEDCAVSDERLAHVIEYYLATPHRRIALDVNAPGPLGAVQ